jgi:hypothetical protein
MCQMVTPYQDGLKIDIFFQKFQKFSQKRHVIVQIS